MRMRSLIVTMVGMTLVGASIYASRELLQVQPATASIDQSGLRMVSVVVAGEDIPFGETLDASKLTTIQWPVDAVPPGTYKDFTELTPPNGGEPRRAKRAMSQGELVLATKISDFGEKVTIVQTLKPNSRAVAIKVDAQTAVGGFVTPGDRIDILLTQGNGANMSAVTILQNVRVIGVDQQADELNDSTAVAKTITVEVTPEEGQKLALAQRAGTLSLSLRTLDAVVDDNMGTIRLSDILNEPVIEPEPEPEPEPVVVVVPKKTIKVRRGADVQRVELDQDVTE